LAVVPFAWHYDPVFLRAAIGAGIALGMFLVRLTDPLSQHMQASPACGTSVAGSLAPVVKRELLSLPVPGVRFASVH